MNLTIRFFGAFRDHVPSGSAMLEISKEMTTAELRKLIASQLSTLAPGAPVTLLAESALANDREVLTDASIVKPGETVAVLPPVCGG